MANVTVESIVHTPIQLCWINLQRFWPLQVFVILYVHQDLIPRSIHPCVLSKLNIIPFF